MKKKRMMIWKISLRKTWKKNLKKKITIMMTYCSLKEEKVEKKEKREELKTLKTQLMTIKERLAMKTMRIEEIKETLKKS